MNNKMYFYITSIVISLFVMLPLGLRAQENNVMQKQESEGNAILDYFEQNRKANKNSEIDIHITVIDDAGKPLDNVKTEITFRRLDLKSSTFWNPQPEYKNQTVTINSAYDVHEKGWPSLELFLSKDGYFPENRTLCIDAENSNYHLKQTIEVKMYKRGNPADLFDVDGNLEYSFESKSKKICDLSLLQTFKMRKLEASNEIEDNEDSYEEIEDNVLEMKTIGLTKKQDGKYIELDFLRDKKGNIVYNKQDNAIPYPSSLVIRFHSDDPDDGFISMKELDPTMTHHEYRCKYITAPTGKYGKKELIISMKQLDSTDRYPFESKKNYVFLKCGSYFGKAEFKPYVVSTNSKEKTIRSVSINMCLVVNKKDGDRNLTDF